MQKTKLYQITPYDHFLLVKEMLIYLLSGVAYYFIVQYFNDKVTVTLLYLILAIYLLVQSIPAIYLHFQYYSLNKDLIVWINYADQTINITDKIAKYKFDLAQITCVEMVLPYTPFMNQKRGLYLWERYYFSAVEFEGGYTVLLTSLLIDDLNEVFNSFGIVVKKERVIFPIIPI